MTLEGGQLACDHTMCKTKGGTVRTFEITYPDDQRLTTDLCKRHAEPLTELRNKTLRHVPTTARHIPVPRGASTEAMSADDLPSDL